MEPKNQDLKGEKNGITNSTVTVSTLVVGPIFRKVSEAFCVSTDKMIQILIIIWNCTRKSWVIAIAQQDLAFNKKQVNVKEFYFIIYFTYRSQDQPRGSLFFKNESVALLCGSLLF
ncbi:unnamed protein product [Rhizophagus irregularis]|nr:unnamed protein product [Rhizophagus irregularis]